MVADRIYGRGFLEGSNGRTSLLYFTAAVPMVGFVHGAADLNRVNPTGFEGYAKTRFIKRAHQWLNPHRDGLWAYDGLPELMGLLAALAFITALDAPISQQLRVPHWLGGAA
jgi:hypothetical protein